MLWVVFFLIVMVLAAIFLPMGVIGVIIFFFIVTALGALFVLISGASGITEKYKRRGIWLAAIKQAHQMDEVVSDEAILPETELG